MKSLGFVHIMFGKNGRLKLCKWSMSAVISATTVGGRLAPHRARQYRHRADCSSAMPPDVLSVRLFVLVTEIGRALFVQRHDCD